MVALGGDGRGVVRAGGFLGEMAAAVLPSLPDADAASFPHCSADLVAYPLADADPHAPSRGVAGSRAQGHAGGSV
jgi:hypothetical protein